MLHFSLSIAGHLPLYRAGLDGFLLVGSGQPLLVGRGSLASLTSWLQQSIQLRGGASDTTGGGLGYRFSSSLPTAVTAAIVHRATSRGRCGHPGHTSHSYTTRYPAVAVATDGARALGYGKIGSDDRCSSGVGWGQRRADMMVMLGRTRNTTIHDVIVALLALR